MKYLIFDFMGVLFKQHNLWPSIKPVFDKYGLKIKPQLFNEFYYQYDVGKISEDDFWHNLNISNYDLIRQEFISNVVSSFDDDYYKVYNSTKNSFKHGYLTNMPHDWALSYLSSKKITHLFDVGLTSGHALCSKPQKMIYQKLFEVCNCSPSEILFIDDKYRNLKPAKDLGIVTVYKKSKWKEKIKFEPHYKINSLLDIMKIINEF